MINLLKNLLQNLYFLFIILIFLLGYLWFLTWDSPTLKMCVDIESVYKTPNKITVKTTEGETLTITSPSKEVLEKDFQYIKSHIGKNKRHVIKEIK